MSDEQRPLAVLLVEDNPGDARLVEHHLNAPPVDDMPGDVTLDHEETLADGLDQLGAGSYDVLFLDLGLSESGGLATLDRVLADDPQLPIVVLTGLDDRETALQAIQRGAQDYLPKDDLDAVLLERSLRYAVERHRQEEELRRQNERLDKFASIVSHDLQNPLNVATGYLDLLADESDNEHLTMVAESLDRMERIVQDTLLLAKQGRTVSELEWIAVSDIADTSWEQVATDDAVLTIADPFQLKCDPDRMRHLFENLFRNAVEHGGSDVTVRIGELERGGIYVEDDGPGIAADELERVFDAGHTTAEDGTGFGLSIVDEIVTAHDWDITVCETTTDGARFEMTGVKIQ